MKFNHFLNFSLVGLFSVVMSTQPIVAPTPVIEAAVSRLDAIHTSSGALNPAVNNDQYPHDLISAFLSDPATCAILPDADREVFRASPMTLHRLSAKLQGHQNPLDKTLDSLLGHIVQFLDRPLTVSSCFREFHAHGGLTGVRLLTSDHPRARKFVRLVDIIEAVHATHTTHLAIPIVAWMMTTGSTVGGARSYPANGYDMDRLTRGLPSEPTSFRLAWPD